MRSSTTGLLLAGLAAAAPASAPAQQYQAAEPYPGNESGLVRCESSKGRPRTCKAETRGGVRVSKQLSNSPCNQDQTWGVRPGEIWVKAGCRAEFALGDIGEVPDGPVYFKCESTTAGRKHCPVSTRSGVKLVRQLSKSDCIEHSTWGFDVDSVWVSQGCRAEFQVGVRRIGESTGPQTVRCESDRGRERRCDVGVWKGAELTKQLSKSPCVQGHSWGWDQRGVWVSRGCRAEFTVR
jgi:hypothetical protein